MTTIRILSIDGGGIRGIIPAMLLDEIIGNRPVQDVFHMVAGTSAGGIIAAGLAKPDPLTPRRLADLFIERGDEIFGRSPLWRLPGAQVIDFLDEKYSAASLESVIDSVAGDAELADVDDIRLMVPAYAIQLPRPRENGETRAPMFFRSWRAKGVDLPAGAAAKQYNFFLRDVCRATSAAPTYFEPASIRNMAGERFGMIDGGVFANNPAMCALVEAFRFYGPRHDYLLVSLGTGYLQRRIPLEEAKGWGLIGWARPILSVLMDGNSDTVCHQVDRALGENHYRFDTPLGVKASVPGSVNDDIDDASMDNVEAILEKARELIATEKVKIGQLKHVLRGPRADVGPETTAPAADAPMVATWVPDRDGQPPTATL